VSGIQVAVGGAALVLAIAVVIAIANGGGSGTTTSSARTPRRSLSAVRRSLPAPIRLAYRRLYSLAAPVQDPASAQLGAGRFALLGGIDAADSSTAGVVVADRRGQVGTGSLPGAQHDAQAATLSGTVYVFGGGEFTQYDHILSFDPATGSTHQVGALPAPASDVAVTESGGTAFVVGGFDGTNWLSTIVAWRPGLTGRVVAHLPVPLRYSAVTAVDGKVLIIGGSTPTGASDAVYRFDPKTAGVQQIGRLPRPLTHAGAAPLGARAYLVGGRGDKLDTLTGGVWAIDPVTGTVRPAGRLPQPLSDAGVLSLGDAIIVAGGHAATGTEATVGELVPAG